MATFLVLLADMEGNINWHYPTEIEAINKQDAYQAIAKSCPPESIKAILTSQEYKKTLANNNVKHQMQFNSMNNSDMSGNDFMNQMLNVAMESAETNDLNNNSSQNHQPPTNDTDITPYQNQTPNTTNIETPQSTVKYFTDNGIMFKIENGILYKKCWETVSLTESTSEDGKTILPEFRIINIDTGKPFKSDKYGVQQLIWKPLNDL